MWNFILLVFRWWLETSWAIRIDLYHWLFGLVTNLSILSKSVSVLVCIVYISKIIEVIFILIDQRLQHLMWNFILLVFRWWLETSWAIRIDLYHWLFGLVTNLSILSKSVSVLVCIVHISKIIEIIFVFVNQRLQHLMWNIILLIFWWWLETSWAVRIDLGHSLFGLVTNLSILSKSVSVLVCIVHISKIIEVIFVLINQWLKHLMRNIILLVLWWWLKTSWAVWVDLSHYLYGIVWLSHGLIGQLNIFSKSVSIFVCIVHVSKIIEVIFVLIDQWFKHLMRNIILIVLWWWLKTSWAIWVNLSERFIALCIVSNMIQVFIWIVMMKNIIFINLILTIQWMFHLVWNIILIIGRWRLKTSWSGWINLRKCLVLLGVITNMIQILIGIVMVQNVVVINLILTIQWVFHLVRNIILIIGWWRLKTSWSHWADLSKLLLCWIGRNWCIFSLINLF